MRSEVVVGDVEGARGEGGRWNGGRSRVHVTTYAGTCRCCTGLDYTNYTSEGQLYIGKRVGTPNYSGTWNGRAKAMSLLWVSHSSMPLFETDGLPCLLDQQHAWLSLHYLMSVPGPTWRGCFNLSMPIL